jgi:cysteinyl-tRNA synthetase
LLFLTNSLSHQKEKFASLSPGEVKIFTCGPSVYRRPHIGNYRTFLYEDLLVRYLEFYGCKVRRVMNLTDVEDKSIEEAKSQGRRMDEVTGDVTAIFNREWEELGMKEPEAMVPASETIVEAVDLIQKLIQKKKAYVYQGDVFFDPLTVKDFGKLYGLDMSLWPQKRVRFKKDTYPGNRWNRGDFILWHAWRGEAITYWETPLGRGRPSWNVQDPAVIYSTLGEQIDINCGGIDNIIRHHDYNIALMEALTDKPFARYYLHGAHLIVDGQTMSKSRGNILYPGEIYRRGFSPGDLRFFLTATKHYRQKLNFTWDKLDAARQSLAALNALVQKLLKPNQGEGGSAASVASAKPGKGRGESSASVSSASVPAASGLSRLLADFTRALDDDLNLSEAVRGLRKNLTALSRGALPSGTAAALKEDLMKINSVLGCLEIS